MSTLTKVHLAMYIFDLLTSRQQLLLEQNKREINNLFLTITSSPSESSASVKSSSDSSWSEAGALFWKCIMTHTVSINWQGKFLGNQERTKVSRMRAEGIYIYN